MLRLLTLLFAILLAFPASSLGQVLSYPDPCLDYVYPAGGSQGQSVTVELGGTNGLTGADKVIIDGLPGIVVSDVKTVNAGQVQAKLTIAKDAVPGRRWVRVLGGANGLTNARPFFIGNLPEVIEKDSNNTPATAQDVTLPVVVNARFEKELDVDCFRFQAKAGQRLTLAILAHGMDSAVRISFNQGFVDASLELLDEQGKVLAAADDTLGLDPVLEHTFKADGRYVVRLQSLGYKGSAGSVYRLTLGDVPIPTYVFPPGGKRGQTVDFTWGRFNSLKAPLQKMAIPIDSTFPLHYCTAVSGMTDGRDLPILRGDHSEVLEKEPNDSGKSAQSLTAPITVNARIDKAGDDDWYRFPLKKGQGLLFEVTAQRHLRSPIDTVLEVYEAAGKKIAENDDGAMFARPNHCAHDFASADSWLPFTAPADGDFLVRLRDQTGTGGPRAIYRLSAVPLQPDFQLYQWPDAVPIWGPGTTACFIVEMYHWGGIKGDLYLNVEGLPNGWIGSSTVLSAANFVIYGPPNGMKALLTITAPTDAPISTLAPFRVVGKVKQDGRVIVREAQYFTLYGNSHNDGMWLRPSPIARAVVAKPLDCRLETTVKELAARHGETIHIPVKIQRLTKTPGDMGLVVNGPTVAAGCGLGAPRPLKADQSEFLMPLTIDPEWRSGPRGIVVARSWASDIRGGRPGPCTPLIQLNVLEKVKK